MLARQNRGSAATQSFSGKLMDGRTWTTVEPGIEATRRSACFRVRAGEKTKNVRPLLQEAPVARNPRNTAAQVWTILRNGLNYFSSYWGLTIAILLERCRKPRIVLEGLADLSLIFGRIKSVEPPDFLRSRERLHRQIGMWAPEFGAEAGGLHFDLSIFILTTRYQGSRAMKSIGGGIGTDSIMANPTVLIFRAKGSSTRRCAFFLWFGLLGLDWLDGRVRLGLGQAGGSCRCR